MTGDRPLMVGLLLYVLVAVTPTVMFWVAFRLVPRAVTAFGERRSRRRIPPGPTWETVVGNLRRLHREMCDRPQSTQVRRVALLAAYDDTLLEACRMVGVDAPLAGATGSDRAYARLFTEAALEDAGVALDPPRDGRTAA
ncbi:MAG: hypothetical protein LH603_05775 [Pseudonocardia sp.]|nr:hypothetical protein [Pseudonocardia sp.]